MARRPDKFLMALRALRQTFDLLDVTATVTMLSDGSATLHSGTAECVAPADEVSCGHPVPATDSVALPQDPPAPPPPPETDYERYLRLTREAHDRARIASTGG